MKGPTKFAAKNYCFKLYTNKSHGFIISLIRGTRGFIEIKKAKETPSGECYQKGYTYQLNFLKRKR